MPSTPADPSPVTLVTGAGSGIGRAAAVLLARHGHRLVLVGRRLEPLEETAELAAGAEVLCVSADAGDPWGVQEFIDAATDRFGRLDALVNNAGRAPLLPIDEHTPEIIEETFRVNALGPAYAIAAAWPVFRRQRSGCIVNISTMGTLDPFPGFFAYAASKASVNLMARSCANEGREIGVRAFAIAPGAVETPMLRSIFGPDRIPAEACMPPETVARLIAACIHGERDADNGRTIFVGAEGEVDPTASP